MSEADFGENSICKKNNCFLLNYKKASPRGKESSCKIRPRLLHWNSDSTLLDQVDTADDCTSIRTNRLRPGRRRPPRPPPPHSGMQNLFISNAAKTLSIQKQSVWWCRTRKIYSFSFTAEGSDLTIKYVCLIRMAMSTERASRVVTFDPLNPGFA